MIEDGISHFLYFEESPFDIINPKIKTKFHNENVRYFSNIPRLIYFEYVALNFEIQKNIRDARPLDEINKKKFQPWHLLEI